MKTRLQLERELEEERMGRMAAEHFIAYMLYQLDREYVVTKKTMREMPKDFTLTTEMNFSISDPGIRLSLQLNL